MHGRWLNIAKPSLKDITQVRLAPTWQYFGTITCDGLHGIMKLYIDKP